ncbi:MAG TPA: M48 family metallopeptidase, partial [Armatimonadota bacterium]|nr:M48 family metallopeptidase [Armatimonadota bacterium]
MRKFATLALLTLAATLPTPRPAEARIIGRGAEISIGRETASMVEEFFVVDKDPAAVARVRGIGRRLAATVKDADFPFEFHVVESAEVNAFALPGGFIYVFRGLLQLVPNDDALAFVLAHEISHVTRRHSMRQFEKNLLLSAGITAILSGTGTGGGVGTAAQVAQTVASLSFTRHDETDADVHGIETLTRAGYNPRSAVEAMMLVKRAGGDGKGIPALLRSHPAPDSRIKKLTEMGNALLARRTAERST